jgi:type II secretion system protein I
MTHHARHIRMGLTLVEVLAALALLAGAVTTLLLTQSRTLQQQTTSRQQCEASRLAEALLQQWQLEGEDLSLPGEGDFSNQSGWSWRRSVGEQSTGDSTRLLRVHLEIICAQATERQTVVEYEWLVGTKGPA